MLKTTLTKSVLAALYLREVVCRLRTLHESFVDIFCRLKRPLVCKCLDLVDGNLRGVWIRYSSITLALFL
jgi:hypothetical protein